MTTVYIIIVIAAVAGLIFFAASRKKSTAAAVKEKYTMERTTSLPKSEFSIKSLLAEGYECDSEIPTQFSIKTATNFIESAQLALKNDYPSAKFITPDLDGGLRIQYQNGEKHVRLLVNPKRICLYWQEGERYKDIESGSGDLFISKLVWLNE